MLPSPINKNLKSAVLVNDSVHTHALGNRSEHARHAAAPVEVLSGLKNVIH